MSADINTAYGCLVCLHSRLPKSGKAEGQRCALGFSCASGRQCGKFEGARGRFDIQEGRVRA